LIDGDQLIDVPKHLKFNKNSVVMSLNYVQYKMTQSDEFTDKYRICISDDLDTVFNKV